MFENDNWDDLLSSDFDKLVETLDKPEIKTEKLKEGERRVVSVLFADIKGFTALSEKLDSEKVYMILDKTLKVFTVSIQKYSGYVDKYEGDCIMALFGAKSASEGDTERAIRAAIEMQEKLKHVNLLLQKNPELKDVELNLRIGINTGLVTTGKVGMGREGDFTVYGDAVNLASRMESNSPVGRIMLPEETMRIAETEFDFEFYDNLEVKGKTKPISSYLVQGLKKTFGKRWERIVTKNRTSYIGREAERQIFIEKFELAKSRVNQKESRKPIGIGVKANGGMGKTRITFEFLKNIFEEVNETKISLNAQPHPYIKIPYGLWISILKKYFDISDFEEESSKLQKLNDGLLELSNFIKNEAQKQNFIDSKPVFAFLMEIKSEALKAQELSPDLLREKIEFSMRFFIEAVAERANSFGLPLILILDDLHFTDNSSQHCFEFLLKTLNVDTERNNETPHQIFFVLLYRSEYTSLRVVESELDFTEIHLSQLNSKEAKTLLSDKLNGIKIPDNFLNTLVKKSEGNPFYLEEWTAFLKDKLKEDKNFLKSENTDDFIPLSVNSLLLARMDKLNKDEKLVLQKASVIGTTFSKVILSKVIERFEEKGEFENSLKSLKTKEWISQNENEVEENFFFKQLLTQSVAYSTLLMFNRNILHRIIAEILEEDFPENIHVIYNHYKNTENSEKKLEFGKKSSDKLRRNYEPLEALKIYDEIIGDAKTNEDKIYILLGQSESLMFVGKWIEAEEKITEILEVAEKLEDENLAKKYLAHAYHLLAVILRRKGDFDEAIKSLERSQKIATEINDVSRLSMVYSNYGDILNKKGDLKSAEVNLKKALEFAIKEKDENKVSKCYSSLGNMFWFANSVENAMKAYQKSYEMFKKLGDKKGLSLAIGSIGMVYTKMGESQKAMQCVMQKRKLSEELGDKLSTVYAIGNIGNLHFDIGDFEKASDEFLHCLEIFVELGDKAGTANTYGNLGNVFKKLKKFDKAVKMYESSVSICEEIGLKYYLVVFALELTKLHLEMKNLEEAKNSYTKLEKNVTLLKNPEFQFKAEIFKSKINFVENPSKEVINDLEKLTEKAPSKELLGTLLYEIVKMGMDLGEINEDSKKKALEVLKELNSKTPRSEFQVKIQELEN
ncbi:MAG: adenylate/guanylate cyclase domain-containing protein [Calditrichaeota bacterium]|nr:MAG: adenylate/guanylate cyclase domain-containing protein [Calditrichota bacterium]